MDRDSLSEARLQLRNGLVEQLTAAGWNSGVENERFERGDWVHHEIVMRHRTAKMGLSVRLALETEVLVFAFEASGGRGAAVTMRCLDKAVSLVDTIISFQDELTATNYKEQLRKLMQICHEMYSDDGEGNLRRLRDTRPAKKTTTRRKPKARAKSS